QGEIVAGSVVLSGTTIGDTGTVYTDLTDVGGTLSAAASTGGVNITESSGDLTVLQVSAAGDVALTAPTGTLLGSTTVGSAAHVTGQALSLTAGLDVGSAAQALQIDSGADDSDTVTVAAGGDVWLEETSGNLSVYSISGDNVTISVPNGSLLDENSSNET